MNKTFFSCIIFIDGMKILHERKVFLLREYKRLVSYIYSYPGGCRDRNVGFAKAEVRGGTFMLNVTLCGVYRDAPESFGIYLLFDRTKEQQTYNMLPVGSVIISGGSGKYQDIFNPDNIASSGYGFEEIKGIGILTKKDNFYTCFSLWEADDINPSKCVCLPKGYIRQQQIQEELSEENKRTESEDIYEENEATVSAAEIKQTSSSEKLFLHADYINAFDDDYLYDCIEVTPEMLKKYVGEEQTGNNSFLMHGFYTYRHLLFGRIIENDNGTKYFIGVPGMYSNRDRYLATMFGFSNFKKSHRSDYPNPYFGYWYAEV